MSWSENHNKVEWNVNQCTHSMFFHLNEPLE